MESFTSRRRASLEVQDVFMHGTVSEVIANSWHRCREAGLDPKDEPTDAAISYQELRKARQKHEKLIAVVRPELELLSNQISGANYLTAFADSAGVVLDAIMDNEFRESECARIIRPGSIWREEVQGTSALGLALRTGETSMVTGKEHFFTKHSRISCTSVPLFDSKAQIVGLLDASSPISARQFHTQALVTLAAINIENRLFVDAHRGEHIIQFHPREDYLTTQSVAMISLEEDGRITGANRYARQMLSAAGLSPSSVFSDLFQGGLDATMGAMLRSKVIRLIDWLNCAFFARVRINHPNADSKNTKQSVMLTAPAIYELPKPSNTPIFRDEQIRNSLRLAKRAARMGSPFFLIGGSGSGRTTFAQSVHEEVHKERPFVVVDCRTANTLGDEEQLIADIPTEGSKEFTIQNGGTLVLENLTLIQGRAAENLALFTNRLLQLNTRCNWIIISTGTTDLTPNIEWPPHVKKAFSTLTQMQLYIPPLSERTDFSLIASTLLARISAKHHLSNSAVHALKEAKYSENFNDLVSHLRILAVQCQVGIIQKKDVNRHLILTNESDMVCQRCTGNSARTAKCREINRVFRLCNSNVAVAARRLGVSRNTVYSHISHQSNGDQLKPSTPSL